MFERIATSFALQISSAANLSAELRETCFREFLIGLGEYFDGTTMKFPHVSKVVTALA